MDDHGNHIVGPKTYIINLGALAVLMALTIGASYIELGHALNLLLAVIIASAKMLCIMFIFMHVKWSSKLVVVFAFVALGFLGIMFGQTFADYLSRDWHSPWTDEPFGEVYSEMPEGTDVEE